MLKNCRKNYEIYIMDFMICKQTAIEYEGLNVYFIGKSDQCVHVRQKMIEL